MLYRDLPSEVAYHKGQRRYRGVKTQNVAVRRRPRAAAVPAAEKSDLTDRLPSGQDYSQCDA